MVVIFPEVWLGEEREAGVLVWPLTDWIVLHRHVHVVKIHIYTENGFTFLFVCYNALASWLLESL